MFQGRLYCITIYIPLSIDLIFLSSVATLFFQTLPTPFPASTQKTGFFHFLGFLQYLLYNSKHLPEEKKHPYLLSYDFIVFINSTKVLGFKQEAWLFCCCCSFIFYPLCPFRQAVYHGLPHTPDLIFSSEYSSGFLRLAITILMSPPKPALSADFPGPQTLSVLESLFLAPFDYFALHANR